MWKQLIHRVGRAYVNHLTADEAAQQTPRADNERAVEYSFALRQLALMQPRPVSVLDVGTGRTSWPHLLYSSGFHVTAIDNIRDYWPASMHNRHWTVRDVDVTNPNGFAPTVDVVTCISVIDHIPTYDDAVRMMASWLRPGGLLLLTVPFSALEPYDPDVCVRSDAKRPKTHAYICQSFGAADLARWQTFGLRLKAAEYWRLWSGPVFRTGGDVPWRQVSNTERHQLGCFAFHRY